MNEPDSRSAIDDLMRRLGLPGNWDCAEYEWFCCRGSQYLERPTLLLYVDGTASIETDCIDCSRRARLVRYAVDLPGFRSARELAAWLIANGVTRLLCRWEATAPELTDEEAELLDRIDCAAAADVKAGRTVRFWRPCVSAILELAGWSHGKPPLGEDEVTRLAEVLAQQEEFEVWPWDPTRWTQQVNGYIELLERRRRLELARQMAASPETDEEELVSLLVTQDPGVADAIMANPSAPVWLKSWAALVPRPKAPPF